MKVEEVKRVKVGGDRGKRGERNWEGREEGTQTAVIVSMQSTKGSCVKYRESESAYSFHSWPKMSCNWARLL